MKVKLIVSDEHYSEISRELESHGIEIDETSELILSEKNAYIKHIMAKKEDEIYRLSVDKITHIESFSHDIFAYSDGQKYKITERLVRLENLLDPRDFMRISNSVIVSLKHIKSIKPTITQKFILTLMDGSKVDVTRKYYYIFKEFLGI